MKKNRFIIFILFLAGGLLTWVFISLSLVRLSPHRNSSFLLQEIFDQSTLFKIGSQATRISFRSNKDSGRAVMAWIKGTNLFFTNEHVVQSACDGNDICQFDEFDSFDARPKKRTLHRKVCFPFQDICILHPLNETMSTFKFQASSISVGEEVYYVDIKSNDFRIFRGTIMKVESSAIFINGYSRHGFSGSPIFNSRGEMIGIIRRMEDSSFKLLPHFLIFGWSEAESFSATRMINIEEWIYKNQTELTQSEWKKALSEHFHSKHNSSARECETLWASGKVILDYIWLSAKWKKYLKSTTINWIDPMGRSMSLQQLCSTLLISFKEIEAQ